MKKFFFILLFFMFMLKVVAQDITLTFNGTGASTIVNSILAYNQTSGESLFVTDSILKLKTLLTGTITINNSSAVTLFPNPFINDVNMVIPVEKAGKVEITIVNAIGQIVTRSTQILNIGLSKFLFTSKDPGVYVVFIQAGGNSYQIRLLCRQSNASRFKIAYIGGVFESANSKNILKNVRISDSLSFTPGDRIMFTCKSGNYSTILSDIPYKDTTYTVLFTPCIDGDNNSYPTVQIGNQVWMGKNLYTTKFNDSTVIPLVKDLTWIGLSTPGYCYYENNDVFNKNNYGALYNWYTVDSASNGNKNVCPVGWHVPSDNEWTTMENYLIANGYNYDGTFDNDSDRSTNNKIAKALTPPWKWISAIEIGSIGSTSYPEKRNMTGFSALPGGQRNKTNSKFYNIEYRGNWWSSDELNSTNAYFRLMTNTLFYTDRTSSNKGTGFSIRCIKD